jgi:hypothetical protein
MVSLGLLLDCPLSGCSLASSLTRLKPFNVLSSLLLSSLLLSDTLISGTTSCFASGFNALLKELKEKESGGVTLDVTSSLVVVVVVVALVVVALVVAEIVLLMSFISLSFSKTISLIS